MNKTTASKDVPITRETVVDRSFTESLGPVLLNLPEGTALCRDAVSMTIIEGEHRDRGMFIAIVCTAVHDDAMLGSIMPMSPESARNFAASLIGAAEKVDGGQVTN